MILTVVALLAVTTHSAQSPQISHEQLGENHYRLRLSVSGISEVGPAQAMLGPAALRLCGELPFHLGRYTWQADEQLENEAGSRRAMSMVLNQEVHCGATPTVRPEAAAPPDPSWQAGPVDEQTILANTEAYFLARDSGRYAQAHAMLTDGMRADSPLPAYSERIRAFNAAAGQRRGRLVVRITWYNNPPQAPVPGIYAAADFSGDFANLHFVCGYVMWLLQPDRTWRLIREEETVFSRVDASTATAEQIAQLRPQLGCRD